MYSILNAFVFLCYPLPIHFRAYVNRNGRKDVIIYEQLLLPVYDMGLALHDVRTKKRVPSQKRQQSLFLNYKSHMYQSTGASLIPEAFSFDKLMIILLDQHPHTYNATFDITFQINTDYVFYLLLLYQLTQQ